MKMGEKIQDFVSRILDIVYHLKILNEQVPEKTVVVKIPRSLTPRFVNAVLSIIAAKNMSLLKVEELSGSLESHELILDMAFRQEEGLVLDAKNL